jgi:hypothetical protein
MRCHSEIFDPTYFNYQIKMFILRCDLKPHLDKFTNLGIVCTTEVPLPWIASDTKIYDACMEAEKTYKISITNNFTTKLTLKPSSISPKVWNLAFEDEDCKVLFDEILKLGEPHKEYEVATITSDDKYFNISIVVLKVLEKQKRFFKKVEENEASIDLEIYKLQGCY